MKFPVLRDSDLPFAPGGRQCCLMCSCNLSERFVYLSGGACADVNAIDDSLLGAFFNIGSHSHDPRGVGNEEVEVIRDLKGGQFDLGFCSTKCLREFFVSLVAELEARIKETTA
jgi:hypothetical protein